MAEIALARLKDVLHYDPGTGLFRWLKQLSNKAPVGAIAGTTDVHGYVVIGIDCGEYKAHRLAWFYMTGAMPGSEVDHRDTDPSNNKWPNLRLLSHMANSQNSRRPRINNKTGLLGVHLCKATGRYRASITVDGKCKQLGRFDTPLLAHAAYVNAKRKMHEGNTL